MTHIPEGNRRPCGNIRRRQTVDQIQHRNPHISGLFDKVVEAIQGYGADDYSVRFLFETVFDLLSLYRKLVVAAGFVYCQTDTQTARLVDQSEVDPQPVCIFEMRDKDVNAPFFLGLVQRCIHFLVALALVIKRRVPHIDFQRIPCLFSQHH